MIKKSNNLKLLWIVFVHKRNRYTHYALIVGWNSLYFWYFNGIIVVILFIPAHGFNFFVHIKILIKCIKLQEFMPYPMVKIGKPASIAKFLNFLSFWIIISTRYKASSSHPYFVFLDKRKNFLVCNGIHISNNKKFLVRVFLKNPGNEFPEK